jgi:hypothetical protein
MRKQHCVVGALTVVAAVAFCGTAYAATAVVTVDGVVGGKEKPTFDKKKYKPTSLTVSTTTIDQDNPSGLPPKPAEAVIKYDKDVQFNREAVPGCDPSQIAGTTTEDAIAACGSAQVGTGSAVANLPFGVGGTRQDFNAVVTAFNRSDVEGVLLHSRVSELQTTTLLLGELHGQTLTISIPPIAGGAGSSSAFTTTVKAKDYVTARCKNKTIDYSATFSFRDGTPNASATDQQPCKQKKSKKH